MSLNVKNAKFNIIDSPNPRYVEVVVTFRLDGVDRHHYIFITRHDDFTNNDYLNEAKKIFDNDVKNNRLKQRRLKITSPGLIIAASLFTMTAAVGGFLTYKLLPRGEDKPELGDITINLDPTTMENMSIYPTFANKDKDYEGVVTLKNDGYAINLESVAITINEKKLVKDTDYTFHLKGLSAENKYEYNLKIYAACMVGNITISAQSESVAKFQVSNDILKDVFKNATKFKTVNVGLENNILRDELNSLDSIGYYAPTVERVVAPDKDTCGIFDQYWVDDGSENITNYTNVGAGKFYEKSSNTSVTQLLPTGSFDACRVLTNEILPSEKLKIGKGENDLHFDFATLAYTCASQTIEFDVTHTITIKNLKISFYDKKITEANIEATRNDDGNICEINAHTDYYYNDIGEISAPSDDVSYREITYSCDDKNAWVPLLDNLKNSTEMYYSHEIINQILLSEDYIYESFDGNKIRFKYNDNPYSYIEKTDDNKYYLYEKLNKKWGKKEITSQEYDIYSNKRLGEFITTMLDNIDKFYIDGSDYALNLDSGIYLINFHVHTSISGTNSEVIINRIIHYDLESGIHDVFDYIKSGCDFSINLPEVN